MSRAPTPQTPERKTDTLELGGYRWVRTNNKPFGVFYNSAGDVLADAMPYLDAENLLTPRYTLPVEASPLPGDGWLLKDGECIVRFHPMEGLTQRFYEITDDLTASASIVDLWINDIRAVFKEFGYELNVRQLAAHPTKAESQELLNPED